VSSTRGTRAVSEARRFAERCRGGDVEARLDQRVLQPPQRRRIVLDQQDRDLLR
jgi:hypothetical protein